MIQKGQVSAIDNGGKTVTVTPYFGSTVSVRLVVPDALRNLLPVNTPVIYATFADNTGIVLARADGKMNTSGSGGGSSASGEVTLVDRATASEYTLYVESGKLKMET